MKPNPQPIYDIDPDALVLPPALSAMNHQLRWQIITYLRYTDLRVSDLGHYLKKDLNAVSYHLRILRKAGLVNVRRSDGDSRDNFYSLNLAAVRDAVRNLDSTLHLSMFTPTPLDTTTEHAELQGRVLVLCTHNSARSQMAEGFIRHKSRGQLTVKSAGTQPTPVNPYAISAMQAYGIDISAHRPNHVDEYLSEHFDVVVTVCDSAREACPTFSNARLTLHWSIRDPSSVRNRSQAAVFAETAAHLSHRVDSLLVLLAMQA